MNSEIKKETLDKSKISLILNNYDDIFSDFDPRAYTERALSHDFLIEAKYAAKEKSLGRVELSFLIHRSVRNLGAEQVIKKRLKSHFKKHHDLLHEEIKKIRKKGLLFTAAGLVFGVLATSVAIAFQNLILKNSALILLEPASWFCIWTGLDHIFFTPQAKQTELEFYEKMKDAPINFEEY